MIWIVAAAIFLLTNLLFWLRLIPVTMSIRMAVIMLEGLRGITGVFSWLWDKIKTLISIVIYIFHDDGEDCGGRTSMPVRILWVLFGLCCIPFFYVYVRFIEKLWRARK